MRQPAERMSAAPVAVSGPGGRGAGGWSLRLDAKPLVTCPSWRGADISAAAMVEVIRDTGLEGLVIKKANSRYQPGRRSSAWIKDASVGVDVD